MGLQGERWQAEKVLKSSSSQALVFKVLYVCKPNYYRNTVILERSSGGIICLRELTCGNERWLLQLHAGQSLLVVEHAGVEDGRRAVSLLHGRSLW